jgi:hypothetical protein
MAEANYAKERLLGGVTSVISGLASGGLSLAGVQLGLSAPISSVVFLYMFGSVFGYTLDILFAKSTFRIGGAPEQVLPYTALLARMRWLLRSFVSKQFFRFLITVLLDAMVGLSVLSAVITFVNRQGWLLTWRWRDIALAIAVSTLTYSLYANILRFDWAYQETDNPIMTLIVIMWTVLVIVVFAASYVANSSKTPPKGSTQAGGSGGNTGPKEDPHPARGVTYMEVPVLDSRT